MRAAVDLVLRGYGRLRGRRSEPASIPRLPIPSATEFEARCRRPSRPAIFPGAADGWPARQRWSLPFLAENFGDRSVLVFRTREGVVERDAREGLPFQRMALARFIGLLQERSDPGWYLSSPMQALLPELCGDLIDPDCLASRPWRSSRLWLGAAGTTSPLHWDMADNLFVQITGRKRFLIYPPGDTPWLYSYPLRSAVANFSRYDPDKPDHDRFPHAREVVPTELLLEPGDVFYLPSRWWHQAQSLDLSMSISHFWADGALVFPVKFADWLLRVRKLEIYSIES